MNLLLDEINWLAVIVAAIAVFCIGGIWYQVLFGKTWIRLNNLTEDDVKRMQQLYPPAVFFPVMIAAYFVVCVGVSLLASSFEIQTWTEGLSLGAVVWLIVTAIGVTAHITSERHIGLFAIDTVYQLVIFLVAGAIIGAWR